VRRALQEGENDEYHKDQWALKEGIAICNDCHRKRCWKCSKPKKQDEYPSRVIWNLPEASPELLCTSCSSGPRTVGMWTCVAQRCRAQKPWAEFSIAMSRSKAKGQLQVPFGSRRCDVCVKAYEAELREQSARSHRKVQQPRVYEHPGCDGEHALQSHSTKAESGVKKMYAYNCPTCTVLLHSSVYTGNVRVKHKSPEGTGCPRRFEVSCGQICTPYVFCFDHAKCPKHSADSYGVSGSNLPEAVECKKCEKRFRIPQNCISWKSACLKGCRKQNAVRD
jgi:hypothetical protein